MTDFPHPLRLAVGSHRRGSGAGCAMNVISYENGDTLISDMPDCVDPLLAGLGQFVNDHYCTHPGRRACYSYLISCNEPQYLCAPCSVDVLDFAHRTVGSRDAVTRKQRMEIYMRMALATARQRQWPNLDGTDLSDELAVIILRLLSADDRGDEAMTLTYLARQAEALYDVVVANLATGIAAIVLTRSERGQAGVPWTSLFCGIRMAIGHHAGGHASEIMREARLYVDLFWAEAGKSPVAVPETVTEQAVAEMLVKL